MRTCQSDTTWSGGDVTCLGEMLYSVLNMINYIDCILIDVVVTVRLLQDIQYTYLIGTCYSFYYSPTAICPDLPPLSNGGPINYSPSTTPRLEGATATYSCTDGYQLSSNTTRTCEDSVTGGRWNGMEPTCLGMRVLSCNFFLMPW